MLDAVIIAGPRDLFPTDVNIRDALHISEFRPIDIIISGGAKGVDTRAYEYAKRHGYIPIKVEPRWDYWQERGNVKLAGHERNGVMVSLEPKGVILIKRWGMETPGTTNVQKQAQVASIPVFEWRV